ncbi:hypothetical protein Pfo_002097 [Paulownia fortunei]|nr:hypothetical protein Pfo_002097 [Paulownia fortunei]
MGVLRRIVDQPYTKDRHTKVNGHGCRGDIIHVEQQHAHNAASGAKLEIGPMSTSVVTPNNDIRAPLEWIPPYAIYPLLLQSATVEDEVVRVKQQHAYDAASKAKLEVGPVSALAISSSNGIGVPLEWVPPYSIYGVGAATDYNGGCCRQLLQSGWR